MIKTVNGDLVGTAGDGFVRYAGISYAAPPLGSLRWRAPQPPARWTGVRRADHFGNTAPQPSTYMAPGMAPISEDCLYLNVWTPAGVDARARLAVLFWIHGGGWETGSGWLPDDYAAQFVGDGIVLVTVNYRLGRLGTFAHPELTNRDEDHGLLANYGVLDNIAALKWVRGNIEGFGGDPANVTVMGTSAGGGTVNQLMASPLARGLFARGISQSAGVWRSAHYLDRVHENAAPSAEDLGEQWARAVGAKNLDALRALPLEVILGEGPRAGFGTIVDGKVIPAQIADLFAAGQIANIPYICGATSYEGNVALALRRPVDGIFTQFGDYAAVVRGLYAAKDSDELTIKYRLAGDMMLAFPSLYAANRAAAAGLPVYAYYFDYVAEGLRPRPGAYHGGDSYYAFNTFTKFHPLHDTVQPTDLDRRVAGQFHGYWANFAKGGDPNGPGLPSWPRHVSADGPLLHVSPQGIRIEPHPAREKYRAVEPLVSSPHSGL
jgi:para-nitrobenzyl esterase